MTGKVQPGLSGYGTRRYTSFATRGSTTFGTHPVAKITQLRADGFGGRRPLAFSPKTAEVVDVGAHPVGKIVAFGAAGFGTRRYAGFTAKPLAAVSGGPHPVGKIAQMQAAGYAARRYGTFGKAPSTSGLFGATFDFLGPVTLLVSVGDSNTATFGATLDDMTAVMTAVTTPPSGYLGFYNTTMGDMTAAMSGTVLTPQNLTGVIADIQLEDMVARFTAHAQRPSSIEHLRTQIRQKISEMLVPVALAEGRIFESELSSISEDEMPCILVYTAGAGDEVVDIITLDIPYLEQHALPVRIQCVGKQDQQVERDLERMMVQVVKILKADMTALTIGGLASGQIQNFTESMEITQGDQPLAVAQLDFTATYLCSSDDPTTPL